MGKDCVAAYDICTNSFIQPKIHQIFTAMVFNTMNENNEAYVFLKAWILLLPCICKLLP